MKIVNGLKHDDKPEIGTFDSFDGIKLESSMPVNMQAEVLIHEILHSIFFMMNMKKIQGTEALEEIFVTQFGTGLAIVLKNNPELITYLKKALK